MPTIAKHIMAAHNGGQTVCQNTYSAQISTDPMNGSPTYLTVSAGQLIHDTLNAECSEEYTNVQYDNGEHQQGLYRQVWFFYDHSAIGYYANGDSDGYVEIPEETVLVSSSGVKLQWNRLHSNVITPDYWGSYGFGGDKANFQAPEHPQLIFNRVTDWRFTRKLTFDGMWQVFASSDCFGYNGFDLEEILIYREDILRSGEGIRFEVAREGSVALYVHCPEGTDTDTIVQVFRDCAADEINWESYYLLRVWWD